MRSCAITDRGVLYGALEFYRAAKAAGIHPVIGCEMEIAADGEPADGALLVLCENRQGYRSLCALLTEWEAEGEQRPVKSDLLAKYRDGLIAIAVRPARNWASACRDIFGPERFFIGVDGDEGVSEIELAREWNIPTVYAGACRYLEPEDAEAYWALGCGEAGESLEDRADAMRAQYHLRSEAEILEAKPELRDALARSEELAKRCNVEFDPFEAHAPSFPLPEGMPDSLSFVQEFCKSRLSHDPYYPATLELLERELDAICRTGCADCYLIARDAVIHAWSSGIKVGLGYGDTVASTVNYLLGIVEIDPAEYYLLPERFLNPERDAMPSFALEFERGRCGEVFDYLSRRWGEDRVARLAAFRRLPLRSALRDAVRALNLNEALIDAVAELVPRLPGFTLERALARVPALRDLCAGSEDVRRVVDIARRLEGKPIGVAIHAAGVVLADGPLADYVPLRQIDGEQVALCSVWDARTLGLFRMDLLPSRALEVIADAEDRCADTQRPIVSLDEISVEDAGALAMIADGDVDGIYMLESEDVRALLRELKPNGVEELAAAIALVRPGLKERIPAYLEGKRNPEDARHWTPELWSIVEETHGCLLYQEQLTRALHELAGYSLNRAELARRALTGRDAAALERAREAFVHGLEEEGAQIVPGCVRLGIAEERAGQIFDKLVEAARPAYPKVRAVSQATLAMRMALLKRYDPQEFAAAVAAHKL